MFENIAETVSSFETHHQLLVAALAIVGLVCLSWGVENIIEQYIFPHKPLYSFLFMICMGLFLLWLAKHVVLKLV